MRIQRSTVILVAALLAGCPQAGTSVEEATDMEEQDFLERLEPHLAEGVSPVDISTEPPEPGYLSALEALKWVAEDKAESGKLDYEYTVIRNGERVTYDQSWLRDAQVHEPILVHNLAFRTADEPEGFDYYYYIHASHPDMGMVLGGTFYYNENTGIDWGLTDKMGPGVSRRASENHETWSASEQVTTHVVTQSEAREFFSRTVGEPLREEPIAVLYPNDVHTDVHAFKWYFETEPGSDGEVHAYLMDSRVIVQSDRDLRNPLGYMERINASYATSDADASVTPLPTLISKVPRLGIYDALEEQEEQFQRLSRITEDVTRDAPEVLTREDFEPVR